MNWFKGFKNLFKGGTYPPPSFDVVIIYPPNLGDFSREELERAKEEFLSRLEEIFKKGQRGESLRQPMVSSDAKFLFKPAPEIGAHSFHFVPIMEIPEPEESTLEEVKLGS